VAKKLLKKIKFNKCKILADKGYPDYNFIEMAKAKQNNFISPPKDYRKKCKHNNFKREKKIKIYYTGEEVGIYVPDFVIDKNILIELKAKPKVLQPDINSLSL